MNYNSINILPQLIILFTMLSITSLLTSCKDNSTKSNEVESKAEIETNIEESSTKEDKKVILCFGNSLTAGYGLDDETTWWTSLLQERLDSLDMNYKVVNAGLSGETTAEGAQRISWVLKQPVDVFVLELGANDMLRGLDVEKTLENLEAIIDKVRAKNADIPVVISGFLSPPNMGKEYEKSFNKIFPLLAQKYDAALIPFFLESVALDPELNLPDGKHPNAEGQKIVLENVWKALKTKL